MCNLYSITTNQAAIAALFRVINQYVGSRGLALRGDGYEGGIVRLISAPSAAECNDSRAINSIVGQL